MPFVLAGGSGLSGGQLLQLSGRRHDLLASICHFLGDPVSGYGQASSGPISSYGDREPFSRLTPV